MIVVVVERSKKRGKFNAHRPPFFIALHALSFLMKGCEKLLKVFHSKEGKNERGHDKSLHKVKEGYSKLFHLKLSIAFSMSE